MKWCPGAESCRLDQSGTSDLGGKRGHFIQSEWLAIGAFSPKMPAPPQARRAFSLVRSPSLPTSKSLTPLLQINEFGKRRPAKNAGTMAEPNTAPWADLNAQWPPMVMRSADAGAGRSRTRRPLRRETSRLWHSPALTAPTQNEPKIGRKSRAGEKRG